MSTTANCIQPCRDDSQASIWRVDQYIQVPVRALYEDRIALGRDECQNNLVIMNVLRTVGYSFLYTNFLSPTSHVWSRGLYLLVNTGKAYICSFTATKRVNQAQGQFPDGRHASVALYTYSRARRYQLQRSRWGMTQCQRME